jgi:hypothetical protein
MLDLPALEKTEAKRAYTFKGGEQVTLMNVTHFLARESGMHRLRTGDGKLHIVPPTWIHIEIEVEAFSV